VGGVPRPRAIFCHAWPNPELRFAIIFHRVGRSCVGRRTLVLCWSQLYWHSTTMWVPIGLNLCVHVAMYYYYAVTTLGYKVWWKRHLTTMQIVQFVIDVVVCSWATALKVHPHARSRWT
jgi:hypothetical protein